MLRHRRRTSRSRSGNSRTHSVAGPEQIAFQHKVLMLRFAAPWRGVGSPPGHELLGVITSHGPSRESYSPSRKSRGTAEAFSAPAADAALSAQRVRTALSSPAVTPAL